MERVGQVSVKKGPLVGRVDLKIENVENTAQAQINSLNNIIRAKPDAILIDAPGYIGPDGFIPLAEQTGIIKALTERVLDRALFQCAGWRREGLETAVSVNVSTRSLLDHDCC